MAICRIDRASLNYQTVFQAQHSNYARAKLLIKCLETRCKLRLRLIKFNYLNLEIKHIIGNDGEKNNKLIIYFIE